MEQQISFRFSSGFGRDGAVRKWKTLVVAAQRL